MRSFLTMLGIIIGIASIITIVSTIKGTNEQIKQNLIGAGNNVVTVQLYQSGTDYPYDMAWNSIPDGVRTIEEETRAELEQLSGVEQVSFTGSGTMWIRCITKTQPFPALCTVWMTLTFPLWAIN